MNVIKTDNKLSPTKAPLTPLTNMPVVTTEGTTTKQPGGGKSSSDDDPDDGSSGGGSSGGSSTGINVFIEIRGYKGKRGDPPLTVSKFCGVTCSKAD
jgi:hypothetical protein